MQFDQTMFSNDPCKEQAKNSWPDAELAIELQCVNSLIKYTTLRLIGCKHAECEI